MGVLALHVRAGIGFTEALTSHALYVADAGIHGAAHVGILACTLIVGEACLVKGLDGLGNIFEVLAAAALVAERP